MTTEAAGDPSGSGDYQDQDDQRFGQLMQRWPSQSPSLRSMHVSFSCTTTGQLQKVVKVGTNGLYTRESLSLRKRMMTMVTLVTMIA